MSSGQWAMGSEQWAVSGDQRVLSSEQHLPIGAQVGRAQAVDLVLDHPLLGSEELERHFLVPCILTQLLIADQSVCFLIH